MLNVLRGFAWEHPDVLPAWIAVVVGIVTLLYLRDYTRRTAELRHEAGRQTSIQIDAYEASVMPLLVAEFGTRKFSGNTPVDVVVLRNVGKGPALGVKFAPFNTAQGPVLLDDIPIIEPDAEAALVCVRNTPEPSDYPPSGRTIDTRTSESRLYQYARHYILATNSGSDELKIVTRSLSNTVHEFSFGIELRGSNQSAVLAYKGRNSSPGKQHGPRMIDLSS